MKEKGASQKVEDLYDSFVRMNKIKKINAFQRLVCVRRNPNNTIQFRVFSKLEISSTVCFFQYFIIPTSDNFYSHAEFAMNYDLRCYQTAQARILRVYYVNSNFEFKLGTSHLFEVEILFQSANHLLSLDEVQ